MNLIPGSGFSVINWACSRGPLTLTPGSAMTTYPLSSFERADGSTGTMGDVDLVADTFHREFEKPVEITEQAETLPGLQGSGRVRDLREAA